MKNTLEKLMKAAEGLFFLSESDYPFETVAFPVHKPEGSVVENLRIYLNLPETTPIEIQQLSYFFRNQTRDLPEFGEEEKVIAQRFRDLEILIKQEIPDAEVYRIGQRQIDAYLLGKLPDGTIGGLKTKQIET